MSNFTQIFALGGDDDDDESGAGEEPEWPPWFAPPEDELGAVLPQGVVLARSDRAAVALSHTVAYTTGAAFEFVAVARGLAQSEANRVFHEQHMFERTSYPTPCCGSASSLRMVAASRISAAGAPIASS